MKIELIKETKVNNDVYYRIYIDDVYIESVYGGDDKYTESQKKEQLHKAMALFESFKSKKVNKVETLISETI